MEGFVRISRYAGMREDLVQASGGNSSFKISRNKMVIKASGFQLADVTDKAGYAIVDPLVIKSRFLTCEELDGLNEADSKRILKESFIEGEKPSIETFLHAVSGRYTLHTHPIVVNALACREGGMEVLKALFPEALMVPYATPGIDLAKAFFKAFKEKASDQEQIFDVIFLQNHGLVVSADLADDVIKKTEAVTKRIEAYLETDLSAYHEISRLWEFFPDKIIWRVTDENILSEFRKNGMWDHRFCPDCVVFLGKECLRLHEDHIEDEVERFIEKFGLPGMISYAGSLYIVADSVKKAMEIQSVMDFSAQVMSLNNGYVCNYLSEKEQDFLLNWEAEKYRRSMR